MRRRTKGYIGFATLSVTALCAWQVHAWASDNAGFPDGYDAVQAAPDSHRVIFENALVRVLEVTIPPDGQTEPIHAGHWSVHWMKPEPMHAIESVESNRRPGDLPLLRVEIKVGT
jgi:hypothetical protein